jgi:hypothetical protein
MRIEHVPDRAGRGGRDGQGSKPEHKHCHDESQLLGRQFPLSLRPPAWFNLAVWRPPHVSAANRSPPSSHCGCRPYRFSERALVLSLMSSQFSTKM